MITAIIQARNNSTRLPNKLFEKINGLPLLDIVVKKIKKCNEVSNIVVATTTNPLDDSIVDYCTISNIDFYRGSENDVLGRVYEAAKEYGCEGILRVTPDDPFKDPAVIDEMCDLYNLHNWHLVTNNHPPTFPEGYDVEIFGFDALEIANREAKTDFQREHITQYFYKNSTYFNIYNLENPYGDHSHIRATIDEMEDLRFCNEVAGKLGTDFSLLEFITFVRYNQEYLKINKYVGRSYGYNGK